MVTAATNNVEGLDAEDLAQNAKICGWTLANAHARSVDPVTIAGYVGFGETLGHAMAEFVSRYADQNERDFRRTTGS